MLTKLERKALKYFARRSNYVGKRWNWPLYWTACDLLPPMNGLYPFAEWPEIAESLAMDGLPVKRSAR